MNYAETLNHKLLSKDEEYALISDVQNNTAKVPTSRDILIRNNMKLIYKSCIAWASKYDHVEADELVYDPSQNCRTFFAKKITRVSPLRNNILMNQLRRSSHTTQIHNVFMS